MKFEDFAAKKMLEIAHEGDHLSDREKQLIGLAVCATRGCIACSGGRIRRALESGIPQEAVIQAIDVASAVNAGVTTAIALQGIEKENLTITCHDEACTTC
jgi:alkylhydroperoxidase/carboxymuconolactone decarboxylase family protein YurZ